MHSMVSPSIRNERTVKHITMSTQERDPIDPASLSLEPNTRKHEEK